MRLKLPSLSLVVLVGVSGSGKSMFARKHFAPTEILSSDAMRGWVNDSEVDQSATADAFEVLHFLAAKRLARGRLTVIDATNVQASSRKPLVALARQFHVLPVAIVLDVPERVCRARNTERPDRAFGPQVVRNQARDLRQSIGGLKREGFRNVCVLSPEEIDTVEIERVPLWNDRREDHGPFDIIGDIHGCDDELAALLDKLGYDADGAHPEGRRVVFLGDLVDRGPKVAEVLDRAMAMCESGRALCVPGNHEAKLLRKLGGRDVKPTHGLAETLERLRSRGLARKRSLAMREFALGVEALERFVRGEPLRWVHECVFGVLALESEPVDPRL